MKSRTDLKQSRILAKILNLESADMCFCNDGTSIKLDATPYSVGMTMWKSDLAELIPCWSLAALLDILDYPQLSKDKLGSGKVGWMVSIYPDNCRYDSIWHDNPIDACVEMIFKLYALRIM